MTEDRHTHKVPYILQFLSVNPDTGHASNRSSKEARGHVTGPKTGSLYFFQGEFHLSINLAGSVCFLSLPKSS